VVTVANPSEWPWLVLHGGHPAWYQRTLLPADFAPGAITRPNYVLTLDGKLLGPSDRPLCGGCGTESVPFALDVEDRSTGRRGILEVFRRGLRPWQKGTDAAHCWWCNMPMRPPASVPVATIARKLKVLTDSKESARCCESCVRFFG
jgi:hypothetical protein